MSYFEFSCPVCGMRVKTQTDRVGRIGTCPGCGEAVKVPKISFDDVKKVWNKKPRYEKILFVLLISMFAATTFLAVYGIHKVIVSASNFCDKIDTAIEQERKNLEESMVKVKLNEFHWERDALFTYLVGDVQNYGKVKASFVSIQFVLYDKQDRQVGTAITATNDLGAGITWHFKVLAIGDGVTWAKPIKLEAQ